MAKTTMNSSRVGDSLSERLSIIRSFYKNESYVWDIGCDHGDLGLSFRNESSVLEINLVDPSAPVIKSLELKLLDSYITIPKLNIHHKKGQELKIDNRKNIVFIAGMGGKQIGEVISCLISQMDPSSKIVLSPHKNILELRSLLHSMPVSLEEEILIFENHQFYQVMALRPDHSVDRSRVSPFGDAIWRSALGISYRDHLLKHFSSHRGDLSQEFIKYLNSLII
jgi:tRNA A22 N-methylase